MTSDSLNGPHVWVLYPAWFKVPTPSTLFPLSAWFTTSFNFAEHWPNDLFKYLTARDSRKDNVPSVDRRKISPQIFNLVSYSMKIFSLDLIFFPSICPQSVSASVALDHCLYCHWVSSFTVNQMKVLNFHPCHPSKSLCHFDVHYKACSPQHFDKRRQFICGVTQTHTTHKF